MPSENQNKFKLPVQQQATLTWGNHLHMHSLEQFV